MSLRSATANQEGDEELLASHCVCLEESEGCKEDVVSDLGVLRRNGNFPGRGRGGAWKCLEKGQKLWWPRWSGPLHPRLTNPPLTEETIFEPPKSETATLKLKNSSRQEAPSQRFVTNCQVCEDEFRRQRDSFGLEGCGRVSWKRGEAAPPVVTRATGAVWGSVEAWPEWRLGGWLLHTRLGSRSITFSCIYTVSDKLTP